MSESKKTVKLATIKREFVGQYDADMTYVIVAENGDIATVKLLNFPDREAKELPVEHLHVFDEIPADNNTSSFGFPGLQ